MVGILDSNGNTVVRYTYNAWGCILSITGSLKDSVGFYNPLRYRGYVWDPETGLYYLQSHYYNPGLGRFINADAFTSTGQGMLGNNMFAYCNNNPINFIDPYGTDSTYGGDPCFEWAWNLGKMIGEKLKEIIDDLKEDADNYDNENTDYEKVYESNYFSSYNGTLVIRHNSKILTSWAYNEVIMLNHNLDGNLSADKKNTLNHEYGHIQQDKEYGTAAYTLIIMIPSMATNVMGRFDTNINKNYYNMPWEHDADLRGGVQRSHAYWAGYMRDYYFIFWGE